MHTSSRSTNPSASSEASRAPNSTSGTHGVQRRRIQDRPPARPRTSSRSASSGRERSCHAAFTWWLDDVMMEESQRAEGEEVRRRNPRHAGISQMQMVRLFDQLIGNVDRNLGQSDDHEGLEYLDDRSHARLPHQPKLKTPGNIARCDRQVFARLKALDKATVKQGSRTHPADLRNRRAAEAPRRHRRHHRKRGDARAVRPAANDRSTATPVVAPLRALVPSFAPVRAARRAGAAHACRVPSAPAMLLSILGGAGMFRCTHLRSSIISSSSLSRPSAHWRWSCRRRNGIGAKCPTNTNGTSPTSTLRTRRGARRRTSSSREFPKLKEFKGTLGSSAARLADALELSSRLVEGIRALLRVREHDVGQRHAGQQLPGHAAGDDPARRDARRRRPRSSSRRS